MMMGEEISQSGPPEPERVLVVDDDPSTRTALEKCLRRLGYAVTVAADGEAGLRVAIDSSPHVIITDIQMPQMDGHTLLRRLGQRGIDAAVIVTSGAGTMDDVVEVLRAGAVDYLKKPWTPSELVAAVARAAEMCQKRRHPVDVPPVIPGAGAPQEDSFGKVVARLRSGEIPVPASPIVASELRSLVNRPGAQVEDVARLIERDPRLCTQVLRIANSSMYSRMGRSNDVRTAVHRIGFRQIQNVVETILLHGCYQVSDPRFETVLGKLWRHSVAKALSMRALADVVTGTDEISAETAYLAGLLSDVGASFLIWLTAQRSASGVAGPLDPVSYLPSIREQHEQVAETLLTGWELDPVVAQLASAHHASSPPAPPNAYWSPSVLAADLAERLTPGDDITRVGPIDALLVDRCTAELGLSRATLQRVQTELEREFLITIKELT